MPRPITKWLRNGCNQEQRRILQRWRYLLANFLLREWRKAALGYALGLLAVAMGTVIRSAVNASGQSIISTLQSSRYLVSLEGQQQVIWLAVSVLAVILLVKVLDIGLRAIRSWLVGVTSGALLLPLIFTTLVFWNSPTISVRRILASLAASFLVLLLGFALRLRAAVYRQSVRDLGKISFDTARTASYDIRDPDAPIDSWEEDRLSRRSLVELLTVRILASTTPVIALRGRFGAGKSSILSLLRQQLERNAIVVTFSTWLPDSHATLVTDLLNDIAVECRRRFILPGLRKRLQKFAVLLGGATPYLKGLSDIFPPDTQRREISDLGELLGRLPRRLVVLLDEIDRMQKEEILTLLKVIRGASSLPNITFVCAFHQEQVERIVCGSYDAESHEFFEKFFPTGLDLPKPSPAVLKDTFADQLLQALRRAGWPGDYASDAPFMRRIDELWERCLVDLLTNIRKVGLLVSDVHVASVLVKNEVDPGDLVAIETVRRFYPDVYEIIWTNAAFFTTSDHWWKARTLLSEADKATKKEKIADIVKKVAGDDNQASIYGLLAEMFPERSNDLSGTRRMMGRNIPSLDEAEKDKRISHPDYFPIYFRKEVPESIISAGDMERIIQHLEVADSDEARNAVFGKAIKGLPDGSLRRYDLVHKLSLSLETLPLNVAESIAYALVRNVEPLGHEFFVGEGGRALRGVFAVAERFSSSERINRFIGNCIGLAADDLFAGRLYTLMTSNRARNKVVRDFTYVRDSEIQQAFAERMNFRFGEAADVSKIDASMLEVHAFGLWAQVSAAERQTEVRFWERYMGQSRRQLADAFEAIIPSRVWWTEGSNEFVEQLIPRTSLENLLTTLPEDEGLEQRHKASLNRLRQYLAGELKVGSIVGSGDEQ